MIEVSAVTKSFVGSAGGGEVLKGVAFALCRGGVAWISGPSGSGKTTLLNILGLLAVPDAGSYRYDGTELTGLSASERTALRRSTFSTIFQNGNLFPHLTVLENILVGMPRGGREHAEAALRSANLGALGQRRAGTLSGGEQQRVSVARALARRSDVLLADEPTSSLDDRNAEGVLAMLAAASSRGASVIVASHDSRLRDIATHRLDLDQGVIR